MMQRFVYQLLVFCLSVIPVLGQQQSNELDEAYRKELQVENEALTGRISSFSTAVKELNKRASAAIRAQEYEKALEIALELERLNPDNADIKNFKGKMQLKNQQSVAAVASFGEAIRLNPDNKWFYINQATVLADNNQVDSALKVIQQLNAIYPKWSIGYNFKAALLYASGQYEEALEAYAVAINTFPKSAQIVTNRGDLYRELGKKDKASADYKKALEVEPNYTRAKDRLVALYQ